MELKDILVLYDCDRNPQYFDDWFYAVFMVDNVEKAQKLFDKWLNEYFDSEELMYKTDRYSYIYRKALSIGYKAVLPMGDYGGFGC